MGWKPYAIALLVFNGAGALFVFGVQRMQAWLPLNPQSLANVGADSAFNTAGSCVANTNWQGYSGEQTMSYLTQMLALTGQNFFSAATGMAVARTARKEAWQASFSRFIRFMVSPLCMVALRRFSRGEFRRGAWPIIGWDWI